MLPRRTLFEAKAWAVSPSLLAALSSCCCTGRATTEVRSSGRPQRWTSSRSSSSKANPAATPATPSRDSSSLGSSCHSGSRPATSTSAVLATFATSSETANGLTPPDWTSSPTNDPSSWDNLSPRPILAPAARRVEEVSASPPRPPKSEASSSNHPNLDDQVSRFEPLQATAALLEHIRRHRRSERELPSTLPILEYTTSSSDLNPSPESHAHNHSEGRSAPIPPPPIAYLPHSSTDHSNLLAAFLLQAIFLGASAVGLLLRKKSTVQQVDDSIKSTPSPTSVAKRAEADLEAQKQRRTEEIDHVPALNLLLSSYVELPSEQQPEAKVTPSSKETVVLNFVKHKMERLPHVAEVLSRFSEARARPDTWTTLAAMAFVEVPSAVLQACQLGSTETKDRFRELNSLSEKLVEWSWQAFLGAERSGMSSEVKATLVSSFLQWAARTETIEEGHHNALAHRIIDHGSTSMSELTALQRALLGQAALYHSRTGLVARWLAADSMLDPRTRLDLAASTLKVLADHEEWHRRGDVVLYTAEALVTSLEQLYAPSSGDAIDPTLRVVLDECLTLLIHHFRIDAPLEPLYTRIIESLMTKDPTSFSSSRLRSFLESLITARQAKLATKVFLLIPSPSRTLGQYEAMLRSHRAMTSDRVWSDLLLHPTLEPSVSSLSARLSSHLLTRRHDLALQDFNLVRERLRTKTLQALSEQERTLWTKSYTKLYTLYVRTKHDVSLSRLRQRMKDDLGNEVVRLDKAMGTGYLLREVLGRPWDVEVRRGRVKGRKQVEKVGRRWKWIQNGERGTVGNEQERMISRGILNNVGLKGLVKWNSVVDASKILSIAEKVLGTEQNMGVEQVGQMANDEFDKVRKVAYKILMRALEERGAKDQCRMLRKRLEEEVGERRRVGRRDVMGQ
ncbi:BZ3500_MvSof-1268-A1-R1_Chr11-2g03392 [Microbotryum saponariae]|uniref:BZ3500_MvSof-1268-A1-R1_Chr11-2g03392 protein n=1 Tax=Microbotryum saponariae TaxID=289078 RepID=A0A2X0L8Z5_9BASI|nr:BZ3500_MvSof-1268-A1-R1_Chr11-2g03392 [Microbotryum saponariae]SDA03274.1 BZ3501_MvSof-1269-A2-R1_Chr11g02963 [Microbotryum saponariae]